MEGLIGIGNESSGVFEWLVVIELGGGGIRIRTVALHRVITIVAIRGKVVVCNKNFSRLLHMVVVGCGDLAETMG